MPRDVLMPALSPTMEAGRLAKWLKKEGDTVRAGDVLAEIETDKATMEVEAVEEGVLTAILVPDGTEGVAVNTPIARIAGEGEEAGAGDVSTEDVGEAQETGTKDTEASGGSGEKPDEQAAPTLRMEAEDMADAPASSAKSADKSAEDAPRAPAKPALVAKRAEGNRAEGKADDPVMAEIPADTPMATKTVREALRDAMAEEMRRDDKVFVLGEEVAEYQGAYKITQGLLEEFGAKRVVDTPITEHGFAGVAVGAAFMGLRPICEFMTFNFAMQAIDQIVNSAAKTLYMSGGQMGCPIVFRGPNGAAARVAAQHSHDFSAWYSNVPGLKVVAPYTASDAKGLLKAAIRDPNPVIFLENEILYGQSFPVPEGDDVVLPIGKARVHRTGADVTLVAFSIGMTYALKAAQALSEQGIEAEVIDLRSLRPMDSDTVVESVKKTGRCVTIEEGFPQSGVGAEIAARLMVDAFDYLDAPVLRVTGKDVPMPYAANLEKLALPSVSEVVEAARSVCYR